MLTWQNRLSGKIEYSTTVNTVAYSSFIFLNIKADETFFTDPQQRSFT